MEASGVAPVAHQVKPVLNVQAPEYYPGENGEDAKHQEGVPEGSVRLANALPGPAVKEF